MKTDPHILHAYPDIEAHQDAFKIVLHAATNGPEAEPSKWGWMGSANSDSFTLDSTDFIDPRTIDLHIWKIKGTMQFLELFI